MDEPDLEAAVEVLNGAGGNADGGLTVWASDVDELGTPHPLAGIPEAIGQT